MQDKVPCKDCVTYAVCNAQVKGLKIATRNTIAILLANKCSALMKYLNARDTTNGRAYDVDQMKQVLTTFGVYDEYDY